MLNEIRKYNFVHRGKQFKTDFNVIFLIIQVIFQFNILHNYLDSLTFNIPVVQSNFSI